jgi:hypothetical protein
MSGDGGGEPLAADGVGGLADAITESFGFAGFKAQLTKASATTQGSGWGVLAYEPLSGRLVVEQVYDHQGNGDRGPCRSSSSTPGSTRGPALRGRQVPCGRAAARAVIAAHRIVLPRDRLLTVPKD